MKKIEQKDNFLIWFNRFLKNEEANIYECQQFINQLESFIQALAFFLPELALNRFQFDKSCIRLCKSILVSKIHHNQKVFKLLSPALHNTMQTEEIAIQNFISYIKSISLHFQNLFAPSQTDLKGITHKTFKLITDFQKFVAEYNQKVLKEIQNSKITVPLLFYRSIRDRINDPNFMLFKFKDYEMKFVFIRINLECHAHIEIFKNTNGVKKPCKALEKLQNGFVFMIYKKLTEGYNPQNVSVKFFEVNALSYLEEVYYLMNGDILCHKCKKSFSHHNELKVLLPPTVRLENFKSKKESDYEGSSRAKPTKANQLTVQHVDFKNPPKYSHEGCV